MPVKKVKGGYRWGSKGKVYKTRAAAERQGRAAYASGYGKERKGKGKNINKRKRKGISRSKKDSTISPKAYSNMKKGFPKKKTKKS